MNIQRGELHKGFPKQLEEDAEAEDEGELEAVLGYLYTHADCPNCDEPGEYEGDCSSDKVHCTACGFDFKIREVR